MLSLGSNVLNKSMLTFLGSHTNFKLQHQTHPYPLTHRTNAPVSDVSDNPLDIKKSSQ